MYIPPFFFYVGIGVYLFGAILTYAIYVTLGITFLGNSGAVWFWSLIFALFWPLFLPALLFRD